MTADDFKKAMPQFRTADPGMLESVIADAATVVTEARWGSKYSRALRLYAAHLAVIEQQRAAGGPTGGGTVDATMKQVGQVMVQRDARLVQMQMNNPLLRTTYGQEYLYMVRMKFGGTTLAAPNDLFCLPEIPY